MSSTLRNTTILISFIVFIYTLRQADISPGGFLRHQVARMAQEAKVSDYFCKNVDMQNMYTSVSKTKAEGIRASFAKTRGDNSLTNYINRGEPTNTFLQNYGKSLIPYLVPWIVFFGLGLFGFLYCLLNWMCMYCDCCKSCALKSCRRPKSSRFKNCYATLSLIFTLLGAAAGVAAIIFSTRIPENANGTLCSFTRLLEKINDGSSDDKWIGVSPALKQIDNIVEEINGTVKGLGVFDQIMQNLDTSITDASDILNTVYENNKDITLNRPDTAQGVYQPFYIENLGPASSSGTIANQIQQELDTKASIIQVANGTVTDLSNQITSSAFQAMNDTEASKPKILLVSNTISQWITTINDDKGTITKYIHIVTGVSLGLSSANVAICLLAFVSILFVCCGAKVFNKSIHCTWCSLAVLMILGWACATALFGLSIVAFESCDVGTNMIASPVFFNKTFDTLRNAFTLNDQDYNKTRSVLYRCIHGDGDMADEFQLKDNVAVFSNIFSIVNSVDQQASEALGVIPPSTVVQQQVSVLKNVKTGKILDSSDTQTDLDRLNGFTNRSNPCTHLDDNWVLNSANCTSNLGTTFKSTSSENFNADSSTCIGYDSWTAKAHNIANRYTTIEFPKSCGQQNNEDLGIYVQDLVAGFIANRKQASDVIDNLEGDLDAVNQKNLAFDTELNSIPTIIKTMNSTVASIYNQVTAPNVGLLANTNCTFVVGAFDNFLDVTCSGFGLTLFELAVTYLVMSFVTFFATLWLFCLAKRFVVKDVYINRNLVK